MTGILVTGKSGQVGSELLAALTPHGQVTALDQGDMDLAHPDAIRRVVREMNPGIIVNAAAYTAVDKAETEPDLAMRVNGVAPGILAEEARRLGAILVHYSTDYVFDGALGRPYAEEDLPNPLNEYGRTKLEGERAIQRAGGTFLVLRTSWVYSARGSNFVLSVLRLAREKSELAMVTDQVGSPTWARPLAQATASLLARADIVARNPGLYHLSAIDQVSRYDFANAIVRIARATSKASSGWAEVRPITSERYPQPARRPAQAALNNDKVRRVFGLELPDWKAQLTDFQREYRLP